MPRFAEKLVLGSTYRLSPGGESPAGTLTALKKDGSTWDLTGAAVELFFKKPDGSFQAAKTATISNASGGIAYYDTLTTDLDTAGIWYRSWRVSQSGVVLESEPIEFEVLASP